MRPRNPGPAKIQCGNCRAKNHRVRLYDLGKIVAPGKATGPTRMMFLCEECLGIAKRLAEEDE